MEALAKAITDANFNRRIVGVMWAFYAIAIFAYVRLGPSNLVSIACIGVTVGLFIFSGVLLAVWWRQHGERFSETDYHTVKVRWIRSLLYWLAMFIMILIPVLLSILFPVGD